MLTYPWKDCPWAVRHKVDGDAHPAWRMRAFMAGDFAPGKAGRNDFIIKRDDTPGDRTKRPKCETCGEVPRANDLIVVERSTGDKHFLDVFRDGLRPWPPGTNEDRCWWCQNPIAAKDKDDLCGRCARLSRKGDRAEADPEPDPPPQIDNPLVGVPYPTNVVM